MEMSTYFFKCSWYENIRTFPLFYEKFITNIFQSIYRQFIRNRCNCIHKNCCKILFLFSQVDTKQLHWICSVPIGLTVSIIGLIGNFVSCLVWNRTVRSKLRGNQSTGIYLVALGIVDSGFLMFFILIDPIRMMNPDVDKSYFYASFFSWFGFPLYFMFFVASIWLVVGITFNRFIMIQFPTRVRGWYNKTRTFCGIFALMTFSVTINIPHFWNFHPKKVNGRYSIAPTEYGSGDGSKNYEFWVHCIFVVLAPWAMIAILNGLIVYKLSTQMKKFIETDKPGKSKSSHLSLDTGRKLNVRKTFRRRLGRLLDVLYTFNLSRVSGVNGLKHF